MRLKKRTYLAFTALTLTFVILLVAYFPIPFGYLEVVGIKRTPIGSGVLRNIVTLRWHGTNNAELRIDFFSNWVGDRSWSQFVNYGDTFTISVPIAQSWATIQYGSTKMILHGDGTLVDW